MSRKLVPGEDPWRGISAPQSTHDRTIRAQIQSINEEYGYMTIGMGGMPSYGRYASVPWLWASFPTAGRAAWARYMPFQDDTVKVTFDWDDTPHIIGYDVLAGAEGVADDKAGHPQVNKAAANGQILDFYRLESGEFDFMSVGGSYIKGTNDGELLLCGGEVFVDLVKQQGLLRAQSTLHRHTTESSQISFGEVRREGVDGVDTAIGPWNPTNDAVEFNIKLAYNNGVSKRQIAQFGIGNLATDTDIDYTSKYKPRRALLDIKDWDGASSVFVFDVDAYGAVSMTSSSTLDIKLDKIFELTASKVTVNADDTIVPGKCHFGSTTTGGALNGTELHTTLSTPNTTITSALDSAASAFGSAGGAPVGHSELAPILTAISTYLKALYQAIESSTSDEVQIS